MSDVPDFSLNRFFYRFQRLLFENSFLLLIHYPDSSLCNKSESSHSNFSNYIFDFYLWFSDSQMSEDHDYDENGADMDVDYHQKKKKSKKDKKKKKVKV